MTSDGRNRESECFECFLILPWHFLYRPMANIADLLDREVELKMAKAELFLKLRELDDSLARTRVHIAEMQNINQEALTYNLPSEILSAIFEAGLSQGSESYTIYQDKKSTKGKPFEIIVSSVSRRWRYIALQTPRLWTDIHINISTSTGHLFHMYLCRSKVCLIDIMFKQTTPRNGLDISPRDNFSRHLDRLVPHVTRWRTFIVGYVDVGMPSVAFSPFANLRAPALQTLVLDCINQHRQTLELFSAGAPVLSSLELRGVCAQPPRDTVESLKLGAAYNQAFFSIDEFSQLMSPMRSLVHLSMPLYALYGNHSNSTTLSPITLPSLLSLDIRPTYGTVAILRVIDIPSVETVTFHSTTFDVIRELTLNHRTYSTLRSLTIVSDFDGKDTSAAQTLDFISLLPDVHDITFKGANPNPILRAIHDCRSIDQLFWPHLSAITLVPARRTTVAFKKQTWGYIMKTVENRFNLGNPISFVKLSSELLERGTQGQQRRLRERVTLVEC